MGCEIFPNVPFLEGEEGQFLGKGQTVYLIQFFTLLAHSLSR